MASVKDGKILRIMFLTSFILWMGLFLLVSQANANEPNPDNRPAVNKTCAANCTGEGSLEKQEKCCECMCGSSCASSNKTATTNNIWTEIGCINTSQEGLVIAVMRVFFGVVTGLAVLRFIQAGMMLNTDDMEQIKEAKNIATQAVVALIVGGTIPLVLNFIGVDILGIGNLSDFI